MRHLHIQQFPDPSRVGLRNSTDQTPAPFPGKFPTRIAWKANTRRGVVSYLGKPSAQAIAAYNRIRLSEAQWQGYWFEEFDRKHGIFMASNITRPGCHPSLFGYYHYWMSVLDDVSHLSGVVVKDLYGHRVYSPYRALREEHRREWLTYARSINILEATA